MHFDSGQVGRRDGIAQRIAIVRERARIDQDSVERCQTGGMQFIYEHALVIRLHDAQFGIGLRCTRLEPRVDVVECFAPIDLGLAHAEQIQIRAVQYQDFHAVFSLSRPGTFCPGLECSLDRAPV